MLSDLAADHASIKLRFAEHRMFWDLIFGP